jgi:hypothetical protein
MGLAPQVLSLYPVWVLVRLSLTYRRTRKAEPPSHLDAPDCLGSVSSLSISLSPMFPHPIFAIAVAAAAILVIIYVRKKRNL